MRYVARDEDGYIIAVFAEPNQDFAEEPMPASMYRALVTTMGFLAVRFDVQIMNVRGHREMPGAATACPGTLDLPGLRRDVDLVLGRPGLPRSFYELAEDADADATN